MECTCFHGIFLVLMVLDLVAGFQVLGTLISVGLMMLPAASARFWSRHLSHMLIDAAGHLCCAGGGSLSGTFRYRSIRR